WSSDVCSSDLRGTPTGFSDVGSWRSRCISNAALAGFGPSAALGAAERGAFGGRGGLEHRRWLAARPPRRWGAGWRGAAGSGDAGSERGSTRRDWAVRPAPRPGATGLAGRGGCVASPRGVGAVPAG